MSKLEEIHNDGREIVYIFGYPRNGTKFIQWMFAQSINAPALTWSKKRDFTGIPKGLDRDGEYKVRHSHWHPAKVRAMSEYDGVKMALVVRDPRDAAISLNNFYSFPSLENCVMQICGHIDQPKPLKVFHAGGWKGYVTDWLDTGVSCVRYEDVLHDPYAALNTLAIDLGIPQPQDHLIEQAVIDNKFTGHGIKGQRGIANRWKGELPPRLAHMIESECKQVMQRLGYL